MVARVRAAACVAALVLAAIPRVAEAAPVLRIEWPTVPGCPASSVVLARARAAISRSKDAGDVRAVAEITPPIAEGGSWQLRIRTRTALGAGERTLDAPSCDAVARTAALLVAIASLRAQPPSTERSIDELAPAADRIEEPVALVAPLAPPLPPERPVDAKMAASTRENAASAEENAARFVPSAGLGIAIGLLPRVAPAMNVTLGYEAGWLRARVAFQAVLPQEELDRAVGAELSAVGARLDLCGRLPLPVILRAKTYGCGGATVEGVRASGIGGIDAIDVRRTAMMAYAGLGAEWEVGRAFRIGADARVGASVVRPAFLIDSVSDGTRLLHRAAAVRGESSLTFGMVF